MAEEKQAKKTKRPTALKRVLQSKKIYENHKILKSRVRTAITTYEKSKSEADLTALQSLIDKGLKRGIYKKNKASRMKSRFSSLQA
ncbi:MAG: hypothetical protein SP1CHLAM54_14830 [Chlamydiia bacterium]|nr:hypothetical protein [Chlamydiia bacterium]MCH9616373.1 hypothetical protein [Chlamydiia bacterium]MCH9629641.1 hypothetical protein [Chlamydiia bacterium]